MSGSYTWSEDAPGPVYKGPAKVAIQQPCGKEKSFKREMVEIQINPNVVQVVDVIQIIDQLAELNAQVPDQPNGWTLTDSFNLGWQTALKQIKEQIRTKQQETK